MADPFPLYVPSEARRLFQSESLLRRFAQMARWDDSAHDWAPVTGPVTGTNVRPA